MSMRSPVSFFVGAGVAGAMLLAATAAQAAMAPAPLAQSPGSEVQLAWCALGFHLGPLGACFAGAPGPRYYAGPGYRACPPGYHLGPYGRRCWPS